MKTGKKRLNVKIMKKTVFEKYRELFTKNGVGDWCASGKCIEMYNRVRSTRTKLPFWEIAYVGEPSEKTERLYEIYQTIEERLKIVEKICLRPGFQIAHDRQVFEAMHFLLLLKEDVEEDKKTWKDAAKEFEDLLDTNCDSKEMLKISKLCEDIYRCVCETSEMLVQLTVSEEDVVVAFNQLLYMNKDEVYREQRIMYTYIEKYLRESNLKEEFDREDWDRMMKVNMEYWDCIENGDIEKLNSSRFEYDGRTDCYLSEKVRNAVEYISRSFPKKEPILINPWVMADPLTIPSSKEWDGLFMLMHRHMAIQCGMFPNLIAQYTELKYTSQVGNDEAVPLSRERQTIFDAIMKYISKGEWKAPATVENVKKFMHVVLGQEPSLMDPHDIQMPKKLWRLLERGRTSTNKDANTRVEITWAKIAGLFYSKGLLEGQPDGIMKRFFGELKNLKSSFSKGKKTKDKGYREIQPFLEKYIEKIIKT